MERLFTDVYNVSDYRNFTYIYIYSFSRRFYPKRLTNEDFTEKGSEFTAFWLAFSI